MPGPCVVAVVVVAPGVVVVVGFPVTPGPVVVPSAPPPPSTHWLLPAGASENDANHSRMGSRVRSVNDYY